MISDHGQAVREFTSRTFRTEDLRNGRLEMTRKWQPDKLWDVHTPQNVYEAAVSLVEGEQLVDAAIPLRFGFREFWIEGRDFYLNGTRIFLSALPLDNAQVERPGGQLRGGQGEPGAAQGVRHQLRLYPQLRLRAGHTSASPRSCARPTTWGCSWPSRSPTSPSTTGRCRTRPRGTATPATRSSTSRVAGNHPSVVFYAMSHNATGYDEDMNPDLIDGIHSARSPWSDNNVQAGPGGRGDRRSGSTPAASSITIRRATWARCTHEFLHEHGPGAGARRLVRALGHARASSRCSPASTGRRAPGTGRCIAAGTRACGPSAAPGAVGVLRRRVELAVPRRPRLPDQRGGEDQPPLGGPAVPRRPALASLGLPVPGRLAGFRRPA